MDGPDTGIWQPLGKECAADRAHARQGGTRAAPERTTGWVERKLSVTGARLEAEGGSPDVVACRIVGIVRPVLSTARREGR